MNFIDIRERSLVRLHEAKYDLKLTPDEDIKAEKRIIVLNGRKKEK